MTIDNLRPIFDRVIIRRDDFDNVSESGIVKTYHPEAKRVFTGTVVAVGPGDVNHRGVFIKTTLRPGQRVLWQKYAGADFEMNHSGLGKNCVQCREVDVIAEIVEESTDSREKAAAALLRDIAQDAA